MFRSKRHPVVVPQAEHARMAGAIAAVRANPPPLPFESFVRGVALHDRGYGELDDDEIGATSPERWADVERRGFTERSGDEHPARASLARRTP